MSMPPAPSPRIDEQLRAADEILPELRECSLHLRQLWFDAPCASTRQITKCLCHRLSPYIQVFETDPQTMVLAEQAEERVYRQWRTSLNRTLQIEDFMNFVATATQGDGALRTTPVWISSQDGNEHVAMVSATEASDRLRTLVDWLNDGTLGEGTLRAVRALAMINNAHAFNDANGRLGRAVFNLCLHDHGMRETCFVPLSTFAVLSHGGYEIRLREAELLNEWEGLLSYHCDVISLYSKLDELPARKE
ncbi:TPA: Fic family protein [Stenotrophomonas maltophilia]|nr:Fic family protein [Stenotrophomonas maltophilia]